MYVSCFVAGIVKGLVEHNDPYRHFGSTLAYLEHLRAAMESGLVELVCEEDLSSTRTKVTVKGLIWYQTHNLAQYPDHSRSYSWNENEFEVEDLA
jgi:hypothetical protein